MAIDKKLLDYARIAQADAAQIIRDLCKLPAPSHHEELRAEYCRKWFVDNGFKNVTVDKALNVIAPINDNGSNDICACICSGKHHGWDRGVLGL